jgi:hypothetical protein
MAPRAKDADETEEEDADEDEQGNASIPESQSHMASLTRKISSWKLARRGSLLGDALVVDAFFTWLMPSLIPTFLSPRRRRKDLFAASHTVIACSSRH